MRTTLEKIDFDGREYTSKALNNLARKWFDRLDTRCDALKEAQTDFSITEEYADEMRVQRAQKRVEQANDKLDNIQEAFKSPNAKMEEDVTSKFDDRDVERETDEPSDEECEEVADGRFDD